MATKPRRKKYEKPTFDENAARPAAVDPYKIMHLSADDEERIARAQRAVRKFRAQLPSINGYVRAITKNPRTRVQLYAGPPATDGDTIFMQPPIAFGDELKHDKRWCQARDEHEILICEACRNAEDAGLSIRHECAHIIFDSFAEVSEDDKIGLLDLALKEYGAEKDGTRASKLKERLENYKRELSLEGKPFSYVAANNTISPYLPFIFNGLEDARVNIAMYNARPGTYKMFKAHAAGVFTRGVEQIDGSWMAWRDQPLDAQAVVALYAKAIGFPYEGFFDHEVEEALKDPEIERLCKKAQDARSARSVYKLGFPMLEALRKHGFCKRPEDVEDEEEGAGEGGLEEGEGEPSGDGEGNEAGTSSGRVKGSSPADSSSENGDESDESDDSSQSGQDSDDDSSDEDEDGDGGSAGEDDDEAGGSGANHGSPEDVAKAMKAISGHEDFGGGWGSSDDGETPAAPTDEQLEVSRAVHQSEYFDQPSSAIFGVNIWEDHDPSAPGWQKDDYYSRYYGETEVAPESVMQPALTKMRIVFSDNRKKRKHPNLRKGRISTKHLRRILTDDDRLFQKRTEPGERDYFVCIGLDISGSTSNGNIRLIKEAGLAQAELLHRAGVKFAIYAHTGTRRRTAGAMGSHAQLFIDMHAIKAPRDLWDDRARARLTGLCPASANLDGHSLEFYRKVTEQQQATDKLIMYYTDGKMPAENYTEELEVLQRELRAMPKRNIGVVGVGIRTDSPVEHGLDTIQINELADVPLVVDELKTRLTRNDDKRTLLS